MTENDENRTVGCLSKRKSLTRCTSSANQGCPIGGGFMKKIILKVLITMLYVMILMIAFAKTAK